MVVSGHRSFLGVSDLRGPRKAVPPRGTGRPGHAASTEAHGSGRRPSSAAGGPVARLPWSHSLAALHLYLTHPWRCPFVFLGTGLSPRFPAYRDWWGRRMARPLGKTTCPCPRTSEPEDHAGRRRHAEAPPGRSGSRVHAPLRPRVHGSAVRGRRTVATTERPPADERINQLVQRVQ